jgi:hypothetical protein
MSRIEWGKTEDVSYQGGIDRGVLYLQDQSGVAWNGLISVVESIRDTSESLYFDGQKYADSQDSGAFFGKITAYTYPDEFSIYDGHLELNTGLVATEQPLSSFGLVYRTLIGDNNSNDYVGYKLHILYNLLAEAQPIGYSSIDSNVNPIIFEWAITSWPVNLSDYRPTAYAVIDSRYIDPQTLASIEDTLYGSEFTQPTLIPLEELIGSGQVIIIINNGDGTWTAQGPDELITMLDATTFQITQVNAVYLDADTYTVWST